MPVARTAGAVQPGQGSVTSAVDGEGVLALDGAVFVDDTGRRARWWAVVAGVVSLLLAGFLVVLGASVLAPVGGPGLHLPAAAHGRLPPPAAGRVSAPTAAPTVTSAAGRG